MKLEIKEIDGVPVTGSPDRARTEGREVLIHKIEMGYQTTNTPGYHNRLDVNTLLGANRHLCSEMRNVITTAVSQFLSCTKHKV